MHTTHVCYFLLHSYDMNAETHLNYLNNQYITMNSHIEIIQFERVFTQIVKIKSMFVLLVLLKIQPILKINYLFRATGAVDIGSSELFRQRFKNCIINLDLKAMINHCTQKTILSDVISLLYVTMNMINMYETLNMSKLV